jgi:hypothetical protein
MRNLIFIALMIMAADAFASQTVTYKFEYAENPGVLVCDGPWSGNWKSLNCITVAETGGNGFKVDKVTNGGQDAQVLINGKDDIRNLLAQASPTRPLYVVLDLDKNNVSYGFDSANLILDGQKNCRQP